MTTALACGDGTNWSWSLGSTSNSNDFTLSGDWSSHHFQAWTNGQTKCSTCDEWHYGYHVCRGPVIIHPTTIPAILHPVVEKVVEKPAEPKTMEDLREDPTFHHGVTLGLLVGAVVAIALLIGGGLVWTMVR